MVKKPARYGSVWFKCDKDIYERYKELIQKTGMSVSKDLTEHMLKTIEIIESREK